VGVVVERTVVNRCACPSRYADLLAGWTGALARRLGPDLRAAGCPSVLLRAGCGRGCGLQALLRMRLSGERPGRWVVRSVPPSDADLSAGPGPVSSSGLLLAASTVFLTTDRLVGGGVPASFLAPDIRRVYFPPLSLWRGFLEGLDERLDADPVPATEVFAVLVADGMDVREAVVCAVALVS